MGPAPAAGPYKHPPVASPTSRTLDARAPPRSSPEAAPARRDGPSTWRPREGIGEPPVISSTPAIIAAIRDATGFELSRVPVKPEDIALNGL